MSNPAVKVVPSDASAVTAIEPLLRAIIKRIYDDQPFQADIRIVEDYLQQRRLLVQAGKLDMSYDWAGDLATAEIHYKVALDWIPHHREIRETYIKYWRDRTEKASRTLVELALHGIKTLMLLHGAVALGALNILTSKGASIPTVVAAKLALPFALIGILMLGFGQLILVQVVSNLNGVVAGKLSTKLPWPKVRALGRFWERAYKPAKYSDYLIIGSIVWFAVYSAILCIVLLS